MTQNFNWHLVREREEKEWAIGSNEKQGPPPIPVIQSMGGKQPSFEKAKVEAESGGDCHLFVRGRK